MASHNQSDDARSQIREALYGLLIEKIRNDQYPSVTQMDMVEAGANQQQLREYAEALLSKIESDEYPSIDMLRRLAAGVS